MVGFPIHDDQFVGTVIEGLICRDTQSDIPNQLAAPPIITVHPS
jgi:hypothetical protein